MIAWVYSTHKEAIITQFKINQLDWRKRRRPSQTLTPTRIECEDFQKIHNHFSKTWVSFNDGSHRQMIGRVVLNTVTQEWELNALSADGLSVAATLIET
ncbi:hypothetical protein [Paraferrimonas sedimenticola]|uniref:Uncharacterized protein n=1 Tax=Paraferrimonas sedimenticola TaxID=375674 RepID=A0AA37RX20_9GAMM|nr:hypothetical protein [Paraferrimonas sedimenticola]GLP96855.1 hypothetical protein GCM10007895_21610 [Paraferrimonas sedimenticola]